MTNYNNTYVLKLDIKEQQPNLPIKIVQNDTVFLNIELYDAGQKMDLKEGEQFVVSTIHETTGEVNSGIAKYDGEQFVVYELRKADMKQTGNYLARFSSYKDRHRVSSLSFRYTVFEDLEHVGGSEEELTLLQQIFMQLEETGKVAQRQGEYAEDRGDYANAAGDYANDSAASNMLNWKDYVQTISERNSRYPNPNNGDVVFVVEDNKVYRYDGIDSMSWEAIQGWDATVIQQLYAVKEDKTVVAKLREDFEKLTIGGRNLIKQYDFTSNNTYNSIEKLSTTFQTGLPIFKVTTTASGNPPLYLHNTTQKISVLPNQHVVASVWVKTGDTNSINSAIRLYEGSQAVALNNFTVTSSEGWKRVSVSYFNNTTSEKMLNFYLYPENRIGSILHLTSPKVEHGNRATDWSPNIEEIVATLNSTISGVETSLTSSINNYKVSNDARVLKVENELNTNVVKKTVYDNYVDGVTKQLSQITQSASGLSSEVSKKAGKEEIRSLINQSAETIKIKASNIDFDGATIFKNSGNKIDPNSFVSLNGGELTIKGHYKRMWRDGIERDRVQQAQFVNGMLRITDPQGDLIDSTSDRDYTKDARPDGSIVNSTVRSLYYSADGISTFFDGGGQSIYGKPVGSGTIEFFSHAYSNGRGLTLYSAGGAVALQATNNVIHIHAASNVYNRSRKGNIVLTPQEEIRNGENRFTYSVSTDLTGTMIYGDLSKKMGTGFRFSKDTKNPVIYGIDGSGKRSAQVALNIGKIQSDVITDRSGKKSVFFNGDNLLSGWVKTTTTNLYLSAEGEVRVTNKRGYNGGKITYLPIKASKFTPVSSRKYKSNIKELEVDSIELLKENEVKQYNLNSDLDRGVDKTKYGFILEDTNEVFREDDAIDLYSMASVNWDASQKMLKMLEELTQRVEKLESENKKLKEQLG